MASAKVETVHAPVEEIPTEVKTTNPEPPKEEEVVAPAAEKATEKESTEAAPPAEEPAPAAKTEAPVEVETKEVVNKPTTTEKTEEPAEKAEVEEPASEKTDEPKEVVVDKKDEVKTDEAVAPSAPVEGAAKVEDEAINTEVPVEKTEE